MSQTYYTLLTKTGAILLANATALGVPLKLTHMAVGDGNGNMTKPDANQTKLIREVRRAAINTLFVDKENPNQIIAEQIIPEAEGGWFIHEIGLFDDKGNMIAIGNCPATYKPKLAEGSGRTQVIRMIIIVDNTQSIEIKIDPAVVLSTRQYVDDLVTAKMTNHEKSTDHPNATTKSKGFVQLNSSTDSNLENQAATPLAVKKAYDTASEATKKANDLMAAHEKSTNHPDATTKSKGFVQLNSSTDSNLENQAATPLAVKKAYDLANGALKKSGDTMTGQLILPKNGLKISYDNKNIMALVTSGDNYSHVFYDAEKQKWLSKLVYGSTANTWSFQYVDDVLINNKSVLKIGDYGIGSFVGASLSNPDDVLPGGCYATRTTAFPELTEYKNRNDSASLVVLPSTTKNWRVEMLAIVHGAFPRIFFRCATINGKQPLHEAITTVNINNYIPVGIPLPWPTNQPPSGWFECNGSTFDKNQFPKLAAAYPAGSLPDLRGVFIRGMDNGRGLDPNRNILSYQDDAIRNIYGELSPISETFGAAHVASGAFEYFEKHSDHTPTSIDRGLAGGVTFDASRIVPTANENRPRNVAFMYIVKAE